MYVLLAFADLRLSAYATDTSLKFQKRSIFRQAYNGLFECAGATVKTDEELLIRRN